jgi:alkylation response protein AidB-like acyl-CoA dehydrogenase
MTTEQNIFRSSVERFAAEAYDFESWRRLRHQIQPFDRARWKQMVELGWTGLGVAEEWGGLGGSIEDMLILMEQFGRSLMLEPYVSTVVLSARLLEAGNRDWCAKLLPAIAGGDTFVTVASAEKGTNFFDPPQQLTAQRTSSGFELNGIKEAVFDAIYADWIIVSARLVDEPGGWGLFVLPCGFKDLERQDYRGLDYRTTSDLTFNKVGLPESSLLVDPTRSEAVLSRALDHAVLARTSEALGCMHAMHALTLDYLKVRRQFDVPIGSFQALQHRAAEMAIACEEAGAALEHAAAYIEAPTIIRGRAVSAAKVKVCQSAMFVGHQAIQLHGAIGLTDEISLGHLHKRVMAICAGYGSVDEHMRRFEEASRLPGKVGS